MKLGHPIWSVSHMEHAGIFWMGFFTPRRSNFFFDASKLSTRAKRAMLWPLVIVAVLAAAIGSVSIIAPVTSETHDRIVRGAITYVVAFVSLTALVVVARLSSQSLTPTPVPALMSASRSTLKSDDKSAASTETPRDWRTIDAARLPPPPKTKSNAPIRYLDRFTRNGLRFFQAKGYVGSVTLSAAFQLDAKAVMTGFEVTSSVNLSKGEQAFVADAQEIAKRRQRAHSVWRTLASSIERSVETWSIARSALSIHAKLTTEIKIPLGKIKVEIIAQLSTHSIRRAPKTPPAALEQPSVDETALKDTTPAPA